MAVVCRVRSNLVQKLLLFLVGGFTLSTLMLLMPDPAREGNNKSARAHHGRGGWGRHAAAAPDDNNDLHGRTAAEHEHMAQSYKPQQQQQEDATIRTSDQQLQQQNNVEHSEGGQLAAPDAVGRRKLTQQKSGSKTRYSDPASGYDDPNLPPPQLPTGDLDRVRLDLANHDFQSREIDEELVTELRGYLEEVTPQPKQSECFFNTTLGDWWNKANGQMYSDRPREEWDSYEKFYNALGSCALYNDEQLVDELLHDISTWPVKHVGIMDGGTQVKLLITFENGHRALWKPMRFGRYYESDVNHFYFSDFERSVAEIAAYHLDKVLGFRRAIPTVGRVFNLSSEIMPHAEKALNKTFFWSPAKNLCFVSKCDYYCDTTHAMCGKPFMKEGSLQTFLPNEDNVPRKHVRSPYRRTYSKKDQTAVWQRDMTYCNWRVKRKNMFAHGRRLLDLMDLHIYDFLMGNQDRHHFETITVFDEKMIYPLHMDNGRGFGRTDFDDISILYPMMQCCVIRPSTLKTLLNFYAGPISLTEALHKSMAKDPVNPILPPKHYIALERRLHTILEKLDECIHKVGDINKVVIKRFDNPEIPPLDYANFDEEEDAKNEKDARPISERPHKNIKTKKGVKATR